MVHISQVMRDDRVLRFAMYIGKLTKKERDQLFASMPEDPSPQWVRDCLNFNQAEVERVLARKKIPSKVKEIVCTSTRIRR